MMFGLMFSLTATQANVAQAGFDPNAETMTSISLTLTMATTGMAIGGAPIFVQKQKRHHYIQANALALYQEVSVGGGSTLEGLAMMYGMREKTTMLWMKQTRDPRIRQHLKEIIKGGSPEGLDQALIVLSLGIQQAR